MYATLWRQTKTTFLYTKCYGKLDLNEVFVILKDTKLKPQTGEVNSMDPGVTMR